MRTFINKFFITIVLLISSITYSQTILLNEGPSAPTGPAATCANNTGGDPTTNTFTHTVAIDPNCYNSIDISIIINSVPVPGRTTPGSLDNNGARRDEVNIFIDGVLDTTILGDDFDGDNTEIFTKTINNPAPSITIAVEVTIRGNNNANNGGDCAERLVVDQVLVEGITDLIANAGLDQTVCDSNSVTLSATSTAGTAPITYSWDNGLGAGQTQTATHTNSGDSNEDVVYTVTATDANGCSDTDTVTITYITSPNVTVTNTDAICGANDGSITFTFPASSARTFIKFSLNGDVNANYESNVADTAGSVTYSSLAPGTYDVWTRWGNNECPIDLGTITIDEIDTVDPITPTISDETFECSGTPTTPTTTDTCDPATISGTTTTTFPITALGTTVVT